MKSLKVRKAVRNDQEFSDFFIQAFSQGIGLPAIFIRAMEAVDDFNTPVFQQRNEVGITVKVGLLKVKNDFI